MNIACMREEVSERLEALGLHPLYFPNLTQTKPEGPHISILAPNAEILNKRKRVVLLIGDTVFSNLGILAYREVQREGGINGGSIVNFVKTLIARNTSDPELKEKLFKDRAAVPSDDDVPGLIVMSLSQLLYSHKFNKTLTLRSWDAMPRKSLYHSGIAVHAQENYVEGHRTEREHIKTVFEQVIRNPDFVAPSAEVYVIGIERGGSRMVEVLNEHCK